MRSSPSTEDLLSSDKSQAIHRFSLYARTFRAIYGTHRFRGIVNFKLAGRPM